MHRSIAVAVRAAAVAAIALSFQSGTAAAEPGGLTPEDETFYRLLITPDDDGTVVNITNFALLRAQALWVCRLQDDGLSGLDAIYRLMEEGPYSWDTASFIAASGRVAYCKDNLDRGPLSE